LHRNCFTILVQLFRDVLNFRFFHFFFSQRFFWPKLFFSQRFFRPKFFFSQDFFGQISAGNCFRPNFCGQLFSTKNFFRKKNLFGRKKIIFEQINIFDRKIIFWPQKYLAEKSYGRMLNLDLISNRFYFFSKFGLFW